MAWFRVRLTEEEQRVVNEERCCHPNLRIREKMLVLWLLHTGLTRQHAAKAVGVSRATVQRYVAAFRQGGLDGLRQWNLSRPVSEMAAYRELIRASFEKQPATTIAEACERIFQLTGLRRGPSQVRKFLKDLGLKFYRVRAIPVPPKKNLAEHVADQAAFLETKLKPVLAAAQAGEGHVFFVDAAHFVFGTFLCYLWSFTRIFVRAASGRQRFNVLGAWNAVTRQLIAVTNFKFRRFQGGSRAARRVKFPPANRSWRGAGGRDLRPKCHLPCSAEKLGELGDPGFQARLFWKRLWHFFLVADPPQGRQHVGKRWLFLLPVPRSEGKT